MKKCPKCKAEIQEEARFCLYCMTSFEEKQTIETPKENNKRWLYIIAAVLAVVLVVISIILFASKVNDSNDSNNNSNISSFSSDSNTSTDNNDTDSSEQQKVSGESSSPSSSIQTPNSSNNKTNNTSGNTTTNNISTNSSSQSNSSTGNTNSDGSSGTATNNSTPSTSTSTNNSTSDATNSTPTNTQPKYTYIEATIQNAYPTGYSAMYAPENAIVITKVNYKEESGNYIIPDTIDGKKVAAIMPSAFSDSSISATVKSVTLPATVRTIWNDAFKDCFNLTDLYIKSAVIGIYEDAFPDLAKRNNKLTIHCKSDCRDFDFYYYRNIANKYDAEYEEWNG